MCLTNSSARLCGDALSYYAAKPNKQRGFRWCVRTRATILFHLYCRRILPSDLDRIFYSDLIPCLRAECHILDQDPAWAFVLPHFDNLVRHYATKWVTSAANGLLVRWSGSGWQWDETQTEPWAAGGIDAVEAWMRQSLGKTDWWQKEQPGTLVDNFSTLSLEMGQHQDHKSTSNPENIPFALIPSDTPTPTVETLCVAANNAWANLEDVAFNPWTADGPVDPLPTPSADSLGYASSSASLEINDTIITVPETILCNSERYPARSIIGNSTIITAPATVVCSPQQRQASSGVGNASKTVFRLGAPEQHPTESFRNALECQRAAQRLMVEAEVEMKYHGLFGSV